jgi:hypothetical protein
MEREEIAEEIGGGGAMVPGKAKRAVGQSEAGGEGTRTIAEIRTAERFGHRYLCLITTRVMSSWIFWVPICAITSWMTPCTISSALP